eukprot:UN24777
MGNEVHHYNSIQIVGPPFRNFLTFSRGECSVQNPDRSSACGGLFKKVDFTFHNTLKCIEFIQCNIQVVAEFRMENMKRNCLFDINISSSLKKEFYY